MLPLIEEEIVENKKWVKKEDVYDLFAVSQSIPGAIAINTSTLVGYKLAGKKGAIVATLGVILPSFIIISIIASFFGAISDLPVVINVFIGINAAVILLIFNAAIKISKVAFHDAWSVLITIITVIVIIFTDINPIFLIIFGGFIGLTFYFYERKYEESE
jgi:chromate transporter